MYFGGYMGLAATSRDKDYPNESNIFEVIFDLVRLASFIATAVRNVWIGGKIEDEGIRQKR